MLTDLTDETLMLRYCEGDLPAFQELYKRHSRGLYNFLAWRSPRREWVDEVAQDSWINLHQARERYQPQASFRTYLYQIARNRLIDLIRQPQAQLATDLGASADGEPLFDHLADTAHYQESPEMVLESGQINADLHAAIRALPGEQKEALILQQFNGMSLEEISVLAAVPVETVKSRLRYAMRKLRQHFTAGLAPQEELA
ncbi:ECF family RNA polymerase sigma factor SbrI [soil metagenome]